MYLRIIVFLQLFSLIYGPEFSFNEFIRSAVMGQLFNFQCTRSGNSFPNFMLFTRKRPSNHQILVPNDARTLKVSDFDPNHHTKVIIHGFLDSVHMSDWMQRMRAKLLKTDDYNVIIVDWSCGNLFPYARAIDNSKIVSKKLEELIRFLQNEKGADPSTFHLIGHSMGCHIAARVGNAMPNLGRITALDPALPRFHRMPVEERLDPSDAKFVDVIHSDAGYSIFEGIGLKTRVGHLDFYPNGGNSQPGCKQPLFSLLPRVGLFNGIRHLLSCDHYRAVEFYIESIEPMTFSNTSSKCQPVAVACNDWDEFSRGNCADCSLGHCAFMGYYSNLFHDIEVSDREYFVQTFDEEPYCTFQYQVTVETESVQNMTNDRSVRGVIRLELEALDGQKTKLDDRNAKEMKPNDYYVYLATARSYINAVHRADFWFDFLLESRATVSARTKPASLKRVKIKPIELQMFQIPPLYSGASSKEIVMCGLSDRLIELNKKINLTISDC